MRKCERGSEIVQFTVALPLLLAVVFSIVQLAGMELAASQVSSEITRACRQFDAAGFETASNKERFVKEAILGFSSQLDPERLAVERVRWGYEKAVQEQKVPDGSVIGQRSTVVTASYDVRYRMPSIVDVPGLTERTLERHVQCSFIDGRVIEVERGTV